MFNTQHRESVFYTEKYTQADMKATIRGFGGRPLQGFLVVGMTGLVQAFVMGGTKGKTTNMEILGGIRLAYSFVDLAWTKGIYMISFSLCLFTFQIFFMLVRWRNFSYCMYRSSIGSHHLLQIKHF